MGVLEAAIEETLAGLSDAEWDALVCRVRGPRTKDYPAKRKPKPAKLLRREAVNRVGN